tara:strand:- start:167 stop:1144 length:978 start_codon:yes stop_codon:yes gene_type:complete
MARPGRPKMKRDPSPELVVAFLDMLVAERGAAKNTRDAYERDILDFNKYLKEDETKLEDATTEDIEGYLEELAERNHAKNTGPKTAVRTIARRISALRQFYGFLLSEGKREDDPTSSIESPKQTRTLPKVLTEDEVSTLIKVAGEPGGPEAVRLVALLEILYATGLRVSELVGLPTSAIGQDSRFLKVKGKGGRERIAPMSDPARKALKQYMDVRKRFLAPGEKEEENAWMFPSRTSQSGHLTRQRFAQLLKELARNADMPEGKVSPHVLRHAFATHLLKHGADLRSVQKMLGHADIATTQIYTQILENQKTDTVEENHPLSKEA